MMEKLEYEEFANVWDAIADTPEEAATLATRNVKHFEEIAPSLVNPWEA
jgi:predicted XRE-type DNA-binding protein